MRGERRRRAWRKLPTPAHANLFANKQQQERYNEMGQRTRARARRCVAGGSHVALPAGSVLI